MMSCPSFQRAFSHSLAFGSLGAMPHNSSAAGHRPNRKMMRAASARRVRADMRADRGSAGCTDLRHPAWIARRRVLRLLLHGIGVAGGHERQRTEGVHLRDRDFVIDATKM